MNKKLKLGKWYLLKNIELDELRNSGAVLSTSAFLHDSLRLCFPIHISPRVQIKNDVSIDKFTFINWDSIIYPNVYIGSYCSIGRGVQIGLAQHPIEWLSTHTFQYNNAWFPDILEYHKIKRQNKHLHHKKTKIGADVWIGNNVLINSGVTIGHGAIIGAGAVVTKDIPPYAVVGGVPAKIIKYRFHELIINELLALKWWDMNINNLSNINFSNINIAINQLKELQNKKNK